MINRPIGISIIASFITFIGASMTVVILFEMFNALCFAGFYGISIKSLTAFLGFLLYGATPVFFYAIGVGLFLSRGWAYVLTLKVFPFVFIALVFHVISNAVWQNMPYYVTFPHLLILRPQIFFWTFVFYLVIVLPMRSYLKMPHIQTYFQIYSK